MNKFAKTTLRLDSFNVNTTYQDFCNFIKKAAKRTVPRGYQNNYIRCWDVMCECFYTTFMQSPQGDNSSLTAIALFDKLREAINLTGSEGMDSVKQFGALTFHTLVEKYGVYRTTFLVGHDTLLITVPFGMMVMASDDSVLLHSSGN